MKYKIFTLDKAFVIFSACSQLLNLLSFILFSILFQCCCQFFSKFLFSIVLVLFSMLFQYYTKNFVSVSVLNDSQILLFSKIVSVFFSHLLNLFSIYLNFSKCAHNSILSMFLNFPVLSCDLKIPLSLCSQLLNNVNNFLLFVTRLFF